VARLQGHRGRGVWRCLALPGGCVATAGADGSLKLWALADFGLPAAAAGSLSPVASVGGPTSEPAPVPDPHRPAACGAQRPRAMLRGPAGTAEPCEDSPAAGSPVEAGASGVGQQCPAGVEALAFSYEHLAAEAAAAVAARAAAQPAGGAAGAAGPGRPGAAAAAGPGGHAGTSGCAVLFTGADGGAAREWVRCLAFPQPGADPGALYLATHCALLHRVTLPAAGRPAAWRCVWASPHAGHAACLAARPAQGAEPRSAGPGTGQGAAGGAAAPPSAARGAGARADEGLAQGGAGARAGGRAPGRDAVLVGGFTGWAACVWVPSDAGPGAGPAGAARPTAAHDAGSPAAALSGAGAPPRTGTSGLGTGAGLVGMAGAAAVTWWAHAGEPVRAVLWAPELDSRAAITLGGAGALRVWRLPPPPPPHGAAHSPSCASGEAPPALRAPLQGTAQASALPDSEPGAAPELCAEARSPHGAPLTCAAAAPRQRVLAAGDAAGSVLLFELPAAVVDAIGARTGPPAPPIHPVPIIWPRARERRHARKASAPGVCGGQGPTRSCLHVCITRSAAQRCASGVPGRPA